MKTWGKLVLLLASVSIAALLAEGFFRIIMPEIGWAQRKEELLGWSSDEYRQFQPSARLDPGEKRILFLGDSFLAGSGVSDLDQRFPIRLETMLDRRVSVQILAAGGWGTDQQLLAFKHKGGVWEPDLVVVAFCAGNDISNILSHKGVAVRSLKPYFVSEDGASLDLLDGYGRPIDSVATYRWDDLGASQDRPPLRSYLLDYSRFVFRRLVPPERSDSSDAFRAVDERYRRFRHQTRRTKEIYRRQSKLSWSPQYGVNHVSAYVHDDFDLNTYQWSLLELLLKALKREVETSGGELVVMMLPVIFNPEDPTTIAGGSFRMTFETPRGGFTFRSVEPRERLNAISERLGVSFFDPSQEFIRRVVDEELVASVWPDPNDRHFSEVGHEILAELSRDYLEGLMRE